MSAKRPGACDRIQAVLSDQRWHTSSELYSLAEGRMVLNSRITDLRKRRRLDILGEHVPGKTGAEGYRYRWTGRLLEEGTTVTEPTIVPSSSGETWAEESRKPTSPLVSRPLAESDTETVGRYEGTFQCATNPEAWSGTTEASARRPEPIERPKNEASLHAYSVSDSASGATAGSSVQFLGCASGLNSPTDGPHGAVPLDLLTVEPDGQLALVAA